MKRPKFTMPRIFSEAGRGGTGRILAIAGITVVVVGAVGYASLDHKSALPQSSTVHAPDVDPLPGGMHGTPEESRLAAETDREAAEKAARSGQSFTPQMAPGRSSDAGTPAEAGIDAPPGGTAALVSKPPSDFHVEPVPAPVPVKTDERFAQPNPVQQIAVTPEELALYQKAANDMVARWGGRPPRTTVEELPSSHDAAASSTSGSAGDPPRSTQVASFSQATARSSEQATARVLIPAGRGIYAHTIVAVDSDTGGPVVLEADSGPISGDRMIGSFGKAGGHENLLVVQISKIVHDGKEINTEGLVLAPATMQTAVATSVDQHYVSRFLLPAAAAFVQGLGSAIGTTSNTFSQIGPLGNQSYVTSLNFPQQLGVGAGVAAQQVATALQQQQAPTGPTIHLAAHANVGVMFLTDVKLTDKE